MNELIESHSSLLFSSPSFVSGFSRVLDIGSTMDDYNTAITGKEADILALHSDWEAVGNDIKESLNQYDKETV